MPITKRVSAGRTTTTQEIITKADLKSAPLTAANVSVVDVVYGMEEAAVVNNLRTRLGELEARLVALGMLGGTA